MVREAEHRDNVDFHDLANSAPWGSFEQFRFTQTCVIDQHVDMKFVRFDLPQKALNRFRIG